jgi:hypothetical protein
VVISDKENIERGYTTLAQIKAQVEGAAGIIIGASQMNHLMEICHKNGLRSGRERRIDGRKLRPWVHDSWKPTVPGKVLEMRTGAPAGEPEEGVA